MTFRDRVDAGQQLASLLAHLRPENPLVLALPRGGVPVACEVARALGAQLEVLAVRKLGAPGQPELGLGAIAEGGAVWVDPWLLRELDVPTGELQRIAQREAVELQRRVQAYRGGRRLPSFEGRTVILVDDGVATGGTMRVAIRAVYEGHPRRIVVAVPVIALRTLRDLRREVDEIVSVLAPEDLSAIGGWYDDFTQTTDDEVRALLARAAAERRGEPVAADSAPAVADDPEDVSIPCETGTLEGILGLPRAAHGLVIFAHGSGSGRHSPRNQYVARVLRDSGLATLLLDLLTADEERVDEVTGHLRFDIALLARRLVAATRWASHRPEVAHLPIGYFGASTGAGAALVAAAQIPALIFAVVSRGGRPDLAGARSLAAVRAPTLLIVGGRDREVLGLNREAMSLMQARHRLVVVPGATHLFEEPGTLETVARLAAGWFSQELVVPRAEVRA